MQGGEVSANIYTQSPISFTLQASYVRGIEKLSNTNLPLMPPLHGLLAIHYVIENCGKITAQVVMADKQTKVAEKELTTGGYALYNLSTESTDFNLYYFRLKCFTGIDNITNRAWRNHLATNRGLMRLEAGRNVYVKVQINW